MLDVQSESPDEQKMEENGGMDQYRQLNYTHDLKDLHDVSRSTIIVLLNCFSRQMCLNFGETEDLQVSGGLRSVCLQLGEGCGYI